MLTRTHRTFLIAQSHSRCCATFPATLNNEPTTHEPKKAKPDVPYQPTSAPKLRSYLKSERHLLQMLPYIPHKYISLKRWDTIENLYLVDSEIAKDAVQLVFPHVKWNKEQVVCETSAGLGLMASELLDRGVPRVRLYEFCPEFRVGLKAFNKVYPGRVELFTKNLYNAHTLKYLDQIDNGQRIELLLRGVPRRQWSKEPVMTVVGPMPNFRFIKYLINSLALQTTMVKYGRIMIFAFMRPRDYTILTATAENNLHTYQYWSVLFRLLFDFKLLAKYTRKAFLPWDSKIIFRPQTRYASKIDFEQMYFVQICFKEEFPVETNQLLPLLYFLKQFFGKGTPYVIPTLEKWFPGVGVNMFLPRLDHGKDFPDNMDLYTNFGSLQPQQLLSIFKEVINHPSYSASSFQAMIDSHLVKTETIETDLVQDGKSNKDIAEEMEEKFDT